MINSPQISALCTNKAIKTNAITWIGIDTPYLPATYIYLVGLSTAV